MDLFANLAFGFSVAFTLQNLVYCFVGVLVGTLIGVLPGIGPLATIAMLLIAFFGPPLAEVALRFGAPEYFSLMLMGLVAAAVLSQGDVVKSLAMVVIGLLLGIVGNDVNTGIPRFTFGLFELSDGIGFVVVAVGVFALGEIISNLGTPEQREVLTSTVRRL